MTVYPEWVEKSVRLEQSVGGDHDRNILFTLAGALCSSWQLVDDAIATLSTDCLFSLRNSSGQEMSFLITMLMGRVDGFSNRLKALEDIAELLFVPKGEIREGIRLLSKRARSVAEYRNSIVHGSATHLTEDQKKLGWFIVPSRSRNTDLKVFRLGKEPALRFNSPMIIEVIKSSEMLLNDAISLRGVIAKSRKTEKIANWWEN